MAISEEERKTEVEQDAKSRAITPRRAKPSKPKKQPKPSAAQMTFFEHLAELRNRLTFSAIAVVICTVVGWYFSDSIVQAFKDLAKPAIDDLARQGYKSTGFVFLSATAGFALNFQVALYAGLLLASPFIVYHILAFMAPALEPELLPTDPGYESELKTLKSIRRSLIFFIPLVAVFFVTGIAFSYYLVLPSGLKFLLEFGKDQAATLLDFKVFVDGMSRVMFWSGLVFELPMIMFLLAKIRVVTWKKLAGWWKFALVLSLVVAAFITPSPDLLSQAVVSVPVFGLFWLGVLFARFA